MQPFLFPLAHPWQLRKKAFQRPTRKKYKTNVRTDSTTQLETGAQAAMYKSVACRLQPLRALLAPVSACPGNAAVSRRHSSEGDGGGCFGRCTNTVATKLQGGVAKKQTAPQGGAFTDEAGHGPSQGRQAERLEWQSSSSTSWHVAKVMFLIEQWILTAFCADAEWTCDVKHEHKKVRLPPFIMLHLALWGGRVSYIKCAKQQLSCKLPTLCARGWRRQRKALFKTSLFNSAYSDPFKRQRLRRYTGSQRYSGQWSGFHGHP